MCRGRDILWRSVRTFAAASFVFVSLFAPTLVAEEPAEQFLQALRDRGYFDVAIHYLDGIGNSDTVSAAFKKRAEFEKAKILIDSVATVRAPGEQDARLDQADQLMTQYASKISDPLEVTDVLKLQSNVKYLRGRNYLIQVESGKVTADRKKALQDVAKKLLGDAIPKFREVQSTQRVQIENFQIDPQDPKSADKLRALQASFVDTRLKIPLVMEKFAIAHGDDASSRSAKLAEAGAEFEAVAELYDQRFVQGQMARAFAARCYQQAADYQTAGEQLKMVFDYPNPAKMLVREGLKVGVETWPNLEPYPMNDVIKAASESVELLNRRQKQDPTWLRIQLELARAKHERSVAIKTSDSAASNNLRREASRLAREVARKPNPHSKLAAEFLGNWGISMEAAAEVPAAAVAMEPAKSFDDAREKAKELIAPLSDQLQEVSAQRRRLAGIKDIAAKSDQERAIAKLQSSVNQRSAQALGMLSQAVQFSNKETPRADLNNVRYLQAYCHYAMQRYPEAAVIGKFLLEKYPTIEWSQQAAGLMVRSYEKMFDSSVGADRETAKKKVIDAAAVMMNVWADSKESSVAAVAATRVAVIDSDFESAKEFFQRIPQNSPTRGQLASKIGQQIWSGRKTAKDDQERQQVTQRAKEFLQIAFESSDPSSMDFSTAVASLYYVDACRESEELDRAITSVEALLQSLEANEAVSKSAKFRQSVYNSTLNCYLDAIGQKSDTEEWISKSKSVIEKMGTEAEGDPAATANVSRVYRKVAKDLKAQFESLATLPEKEEFADSMKSFFAGIGSVAKDGKTRLWAGSTLLGIGETLKLEGSDRKARELSNQAIKLVSAAKEAGFGNDKSLELAYRHQLALAQRGSGDFAKAVESFEKILESSNGINLQIDAAKTLLIWGIEKKNVKALTSSMNGTGEYRDPKTKKRRKRIMGWKLLVSATRSNEKLQEQFRECEYYSLLCLFRYGELKDSKKAIESAHSELVKALKRFPFLATGLWKKKFEQLLKDLEAAKK